MASSTLVDITLYKDSYGQATSICTWACAMWYVLCIEKCGYDLFFQSIAIDQQLFLYLLLIIDWQKTMDIKIDPSITFPIIDFPWLVTQSEK